MSVISSAVLSSDDPEWQLGQVVAAIQRLERRFAELDSDALRRSENLKDTTKTGQSRRNIGIPDGASGDTLTWGDAGWEAGPATSTLDGLSDVTLTSAAVNDALYYNGSAWVNSGLSIGLGRGASATGNSSTALGRIAQATGTHSTALGYSASAAGGGGTALGSGASAAGSDSTALGHSASAGSDYSTAIGWVASAAGVGSTALGYSADAVGIDSTALGTSAYAAGTNSTALGTSAYAAGTNSTALGRIAQATGTNSTALGYAASAASDYSTALGYSADATAASSTALGASAQATATSSTALGHSASAASNYSTALGYSAQVTSSATSAIAIGNIMASVANTTHIANIYSDTTASAANVYIDFTGRLYRSTSSARYKDNISYGVDPSLVYALKPASWVDRGNGMPYIGFIAEDVAKVEPRLVEYDNQGRPDALHYDHFSAIIVSALQALREEVRVLKARCDAWLGDEQG